ncbi:hypothetical protein HID58_017315, partial [Brassica napus]
PILEQLVVKPDPGHRCQLWNIRDPSTRRSKWWTSSKQKSSSTMSKMANIKNAHQWVTANACHFTNILRLNASVWGRDSSY